ncbi:hypothetical protein LDENG_00223090 [Lucifuga dentata]|nr:hypothetical protein LDENG_00223090 [Lucifuga dentata]
MPVGLKDLSILHDFPFDITHDSFLYLGIKVTRSFSLLRKANFTLLIEKLRLNIQYWRSLPISLLDRVNAIKMVFLPQLLYLLHYLPIFLPKSFFKQIDSLILPFL